MLTYYNNPIIAEEEVYSLNEHFEARLDEDRILITTRHGGWIVLSNEEYDLFKKNPREDEILFRELERVGIILTERNIKNILGDLRKQHNSLFSYPSFNVISVTDRCNLDCIYCHPNANPQMDQMDQDMADDVLDFIFNTPTKSKQIILQGGEPLLNFNLVQYIYEESKRRSEEKKIRLRFSFGTNLTLMDEDIAKEIKKMGIIPCTSLDGPKELHDQQRPYIGGRGSYEDVVYWIKTLREDFDIAVSSLATMTQYSIDCGAKKIIDEYRNLGINEVFFKPFRPSGRAVDNNLYMNPEDFFNFWREGIEYCIKLCKNGDPMVERQSREAIENFLYANRRCMCATRPCGAGISMISYGCDGTIIACDSARNNDFLDIGHIRSDDYRTIRSRIMPLVTLSSDLIPVCSTCEYMAFCNTCLCCNYGFHNDLYPKVPRDFECKWRKKALQYLFQKLTGGDGPILRSWSRW